MTEDEMVGWHHRLNGHEFAQTLGDSEGQGSLVCCSSRCCRGGHGLGTQQQQQEAWWVTLLLASALPAQNSLVEAAYKKTLLLNG